MSAHKSIKDDMKVSSLAANASNPERRTTRRERRLPVERRKTYSSLTAGEDRRRNKLEQRRDDINHREVDPQSNTTTEGANRLQLNATCIDHLINDQMLIIKKITKLLPFKKELGVTQTENNVLEIYADIKHLMQKEEYMLCLYLETNTKKLTSVHTDRLLSVINTDISKFSDEIMQLVRKYYIAKISNSSLDFVQSDMNTIREKIIICLYKKKKLLYPIYIKKL